MEEQLFGIHNSSHGDLNEEVHLYHAILLPLLYKLNGEELSLPNFINKIMLKILY